MRQLRSRPRRHRHGEGGFTLVELLLAISILGILMAALVGVLFTLLTTRSSTLQQLAVSHDAQNAAAYFTNDAQGGVTVALGAPAQCGSTATSLVRFSGNDYDAGSTSDVLLTTSWRWDAGTKRLLRRSCRGGGTPSEAVVATDLQAAPTVASTCAGTGAASATSPVIGLKLVGTDGAQFVLCARRRTA